MKEIVLKKQARQAMEPRSCVVMSVAKGVTADGEAGTPLIFNYPFSIFNFLAILSSS